MALIDPPNDWKVDVLAEVMPCPACGHPDWVPMLGHGLWCEECNTQARIRYPGGDSGYIVTFDGKASWDAPEHGIPDRTTVTAKFLGSSEPYLYWISARDSESGDEIEWEPHPDFPAETPW